MHESDSSLVATPETVGVMVQDHHLKYLEHVHHVFIGLLSERLRSILPARIKTQVVSVHECTYEEFLSSAPAGFDMQVYEVENLNIGCSFSLDATTVPTVVDCMFGGSGRFPAIGAKRPETHIILRARQRMFEVLSETYSQAWARYLPFVLKPCGQEQNLRSLTQASPGERLIHSRVFLVFNEVQTSLNVCVSASCLSTLRDHWDGDSGTARPLAFDGMLSRQTRLSAAQTTLVAVLAQKQMTLADLLSFSVGQVIPINLLDPVPLKAGDVTLLEGLYGFRNGFNSLKVESLKQAAVSVAKHQQETAEEVGPIDEALKLMGRTTLELPGASELSSMLASLSDVPGVSSNEAGGVKDA